jgi:hypothetical protein
MPSFIAHYSLKNRIECDSPLLTVAGYWKDRCIEWRGMEGIRQAGWLAGRQAGRQAGRHSCRIYD